MKKLIILFIIFGVSFSLATVIAQIWSQKKDVKKSSLFTPKITYKRPDLKAEKLTEFVNEWRTSQGYQPYKKDDRLCTIANDRVKDGFDNHKGLRTKYSDYPFIISENLGVDKSEQDMLNGWLLSTKHAETLKEPYTHSCIACQKDFCVQIFSSFLKN